MMFGLPSHTVDIQIEVVFEHKHRLRRSVLGHSSTMLFVMILLVPLIGDDRFCLYPISLRFQG